ncbi:MAG TPA: sterol desaturase family protein [Aliidongia sp.]|nr:sterol desaturase family protein [Aliidongia sp.]
MSERIVQVGRDGDASRSELTEASIKPLPLFFAAVFIFYLLTALFLMEIVRSGLYAPQIKLLFGVVDISKIHEIFFRYSVVGFVVVPLIFLFEWICVGWERSSINSIIRNRKASGRSDIICFLLNHLRWLRFPQIIFTFGFALISGAMVHDFGSKYLFSGFSGLELPSYVSYPVYFLLYTAFDYIAHRVDHSQYFWPLHRFHHAAEEFNVFTADRGHPASAFTQSGLKIFPLALLGVPPDAIIDVGMLIVVINYLNHSRIDWDFGWFGRYVIQSPLHHQLHHSKARRQPCNLSVCPIWDRLGGTWLDVTERSIVLGTSAPYRHGANIVPDVLRDYRDFLRGLLRGARRLPIFARWAREPLVEGHSSYAGDDGPPLPGGQLKTPAKASAGTFHS